MKRTVAVILCMILLLPLLGCELQRERSWQEKVDSIEVGMTRSEVHEILGEPDADLGSGILVDMFILPDEYVTTVGYELVDRKWQACHIAVLSFDEFGEVWGKYPDDPSAWWNAE